MTSSRGRGQMDFELATGDCEGCMRPASRKAACKLALQARPYLASRAYNFLRETPRSSAARVLLSPQARSARSINSRSASAKLTERLSTAAVLATPAGGATGAETD